MSGGTLPSSFDKEFFEENRWQKFFRKFKEEPLVPFGCAMTCYALYRASKAIRARDHHQTNRMFRARIYAQGFTVACMVAGSIYYSEERSKRKEFEDAVAEQKVLDKKDAWIRELEARDMEEKEMAARKEELRRRTRETDGTGSERVRAMEEASNRLHERSTAKSALEHLEQRRQSPLLDILGRGRFR